MAPLSIVFRIYLIRHKALTILLLRGGGGVRIKLDILGMQMFQDCACKLLRKTNKIARIIGTKF
jgi:hypothetical protein